MLLVVRAGMNIARSSREAVRRVRRTGTWSAVLGMPLLAWVSGGSLSVALPLGQEAMQGVDGRSHQLQQGIWDFNFRINAFHYALESRGTPISRASHGSRRPANWLGAKKRNRHNIKTKLRIVAL